METQILDKLKKDNQGNLSRFNSVMMAWTLSRFCCLDMQAGSLKKAANSSVSSTVS
jgi:hypothetical protein